MSWTDIYRTALLGSRHFQNLEEKSSGFFAYMVMLPTLLIIGAPANLQFVGRAEASSAQCRKAIVIHEIAERDGAVFVGGQ